jgi:hypothetical protein
MGGCCRSVLAISCIAFLGCTRKPPSNDPCGPLPGSPVVLAEPAHQSGGLSTDRTNVYWAEFAQEGSVMCVPKSGGPSRSVSPADKGAPYAVTDDEYIYWTVLPGRLERAPKAGGPNQVLASRDTKYTQNWGPLAIDDAFVYWLNAGSQDRRVKPNVGQVMRVPKSGGTVTVIVEREGLHDLAVSGEHVYWTANDGVWRESKTGGVPEHFVEETLTDASTGEALSSTFSLALDDGYVYWTDRSAIQRKPISGGPIEVVLPKSAGTMRVNGRCVYFTGPSAISRVDKSGGKFSTLVEWDGVNVVPMAWTVDDSAVFWTVWSKGSGAWTLTKLAK